MNITVLGLWHLGCVTAGSCAQHFNVTGLDFDSAVIADLRQGKPPIFEPGLESLIRAGLSGGNLRFTTDAEACAQSDILWLTPDTPVDDKDQSDTIAVLTSLRRCLAHFRKGGLVLISSQLPVGTCRRLQAEFPEFRFACSPENLRLGRALDAFNKAERVVVGMADPSVKPLIERLFSPFTGTMVWMRLESAEMVKHALNSFLALSVTFINEIADLCESVGGDAEEVSRGLKSDVRIGPHAYLRPGAAFAGGTLARDVVNLMGLAESVGQPIPVIQAIKRSNDHHRSWAFRRLTSRLGSVAGKRIGMLGLTYTPNTSTLRRSAAVELCRQLAGCGAIVHAFDPVLPVLPAELSMIELAGAMEGAVRGSDAIIIGTDYPEFRSASWPELLRQMREPIIVDANRFLARSLDGIANVEYMTVGGHP